MKITYRNRDTIVVVGREAGAAAVIFANMSVYAYGSVRDCVSRDKSN